IHYYKSKILSNKKIASDVYVMEVKRNEEEVIPGQFYMLKSWQEELTLMRPISLYKMEADTLFFMYRVIGKGTACFSKLKKGDSIDLLGPLGNGFPCDKVSGKIALVGGGVGIPPLFETAKRLTKLGNQVDVFIGYKEEVFICEEFEDVCDNIFVSTECGQEGYRGYITDLLHPEQYDAVFTCGPEVMMMKVMEMCKSHHVPAWCSMEKRMGCGIGACLVCSCETKNGMKSSCKDGPVFSMDEL
ncbi:MAG: dihydroorotate dehydrogenase electron transfer subunit, partial [Bacteroidales bacterium]